VGGYRALRIHLFSFGGALAKMLCCHITCPRIAARGVSKTAAYNTAATAAALRQGLREEGSRQDAFVFVAAAAADSRT
jgi:hypothetical protein